MTPSSETRNVLYYGDNLEILRRYLPDESVDLVYLDPPFNSNQAYNVLFAEHDGSQSAAQIKIFDDTWKWDTEAERAYHEVLDFGGTIAEILKAFRDSLGNSNMMAYLAMMAPRLIELRRVMKDTASIYLHCDPTASHYLKLLLDGVFGAECFRNEIVWKRTTAHSDTKQGLARYGRIHDILLYYGKAAAVTFNTQYLPYDQSYIESHYRFVETGTARRYRKGDLTAQRPGGDTEYEWRVKRRVCYVASPRAGVVALWMAECELSGGPGEARLSRHRA